MDQSQTVPSSPVLQSLLNTEQLRHIFTSLSEATGIAVGFWESTDKDLLFTAGWQPLCRDFYRQLPASRCHCTRSSKITGDQAQAQNSIYITECYFGLGLAAMPLCLDGHILGYLFAGQVFLRAPDPSEHTQYAKHFGFTEEALQAAVAAVPVVSAETLKATLKTCHSITQALIAHQQSQAQQQQYQSLFNLAADAILIVDSAGYILDANRRATSNSGYSLQNLQQNWLPDFVATEQQDALKQRLQELATTETPAPLEVCFYNRHNTPLWRELSFQTIEYQQQHACLIISRDIGLRKEQEKQLQQTQQQLQQQRDQLEAEVARRTADLQQKVEQLKQEISTRKAYEEELILSEGIFNTTIEGISITDPDGTIVKVNKAFCDITGYHEDEVLGQNPRILKSHHHPPQFYEEAMKKCGTTSSIKAFGAGKSGTGIKTATPIPSVCALRPSAITKDKPATMWPCSMM